MIETLEVGRDEDRLRGPGAYDLDSGTVLEAEADLAVADVAPYLAEFVREGIPVSGRLHAGLRATGPWPGAPLAVEAAFSEGRIGSVQGVKASLDAAYKPGLLSIGAFEITGSGGLAAKGEGSLPVDFAADEVLSPGPVSIRAQASIPSLEALASLVPPALAPTGSLRADIAVAGSWKEPDARLEFRGERLHLPGGTRFAPPGPFTLAGALAWSKAEARADKVRLESPALSLSLSGVWSSPPDLPSLLAGAGEAQTGSLSLRASFNSPDIVWLQKSVEGLRGLRGSVAGEIAIEGAGGRPAAVREYPHRGGSRAATGICRRSSRSPPKLPCCVGS